MRVGDSLQHEALNQLVGQFSDALACLRELVQNSTDAGTDRVDVWMEFIPDEGQHGTIALHVEDNGEGMDEEIIDSQLTSLFSSSKEGDLTKIGKFGIGFVSVFALKPEAVLVRTGRGGEYWEVLFHADRSFSKGRLEHPVEGTVVSIYVKGDLFYYRDLAEAALQNVRRWCHHSTVEVTFEDRSGQVADGELVTITEPFEVSGELPAVVEFEGTSIALAFSSQPEYAFYNRGLTLAHTGQANEVLDKRAAQYATVSLKVKSRYLEHTLSRETVLRDHNYEKAMALLDKAYTEVLVDKLLDAVEALATRPTLSPAELRRYFSLSDILRQHWPADESRWRSRVLWRTVNGLVLACEAVSAVAHKRGRLLFATEPSSLADQLAKLGVPVVLSDAGNTGSPVAGLASRSLPMRLFNSVRDMVWGPFKVAVESVQAAYAPVVLDQQISPQAAALVGAARELLRERGDPFGDWKLCAPGVPMPVAPLIFEGEVLKGRGGVSMMARAPVALSEGADIAINRAHPYFESLLKLHARHPLLAAYQLARAVQMNTDDLSEQRESLLMEALRRQ